MEMSNGINVRVDHSMIGMDALLKTLYWLSRGFVCEVVERDDSASIVCLTPKPDTEWSEIEVRDLFHTTCLDFALRERVSSQTSNVRDLLLAKAFSESGVLEDDPVGTFGDRIEEDKGHGMFKILSN
jgi:His-Xaa-Ser system protein HxsD